MQLATLVDLFWMMTKSITLKAIFFPVLYCWFGSLSAQEHFKRYNQLDVQHYRFELQLNDSTDVINGVATVDIKFKVDTESFYLDLVEFDSWNEKGMSVSKIASGGKKLSFEQDEDVLTIIPRKSIRKEEVHSFTIAYSGVPEDGLIIGRNMYGDRTFFGDNWPDRARNWLPTVDHPSDKASVEFIVTAPNEYDVIANGVEVSRETISNGYRKTHWKTEVAIPTKVAVIGVAPFSIEESGRVGDIPVTTWVYPQNEEDGFYDFQPAVAILEFFVNKIGAYPYKKLANVQSKTRHGGMENAGNIFYFEEAVTGKRERELLIAHEVAHQWFGNSATEANWHHVWLSEGFATYMTNLYVEDKHGIEALRQHMQTQREEVIEFAKMEMVPIINTSIKKYDELLNANSYKKGAWFLHMLRKRIGDDNFNKGIRVYYDKFKGTNALTSDFRLVMESVSGDKLNAFFNQWLFKPGHPKLALDWSQEEPSNQVSISLQQNQEHLFFFPLEIRIVSEDGVSKMETLDVDQKSQNFIIPCELIVKEIIMDPNTELLFECQKK